MIPGRRKTITVILASELSIQQKRQGIPPCPPPPPPPPPRRRRRRPRPAFRPAADECGGPSSCVSAPGGSLGNWVIRTPATPHLPTAWDVRTPVRPPLVRSHSAGPDYAPSLIWRFGCLQCARFRPVQTFCIAKHRSGFVPGSTRRPPYSLSQGPARTFPRLCELSYLWSYIVRQGSFTRPSLQWGSELEPQGCLCLCFHCSSLSRWTSLEGRFGWQVQCRMGGVPWCLNHDLA